MTQLDDQRFQGKMLKITPHNSLQGLMLDSLGAGDATTSINKIGK
jgi:hypothetical protein